MKKHWYKVSHSPKSQAAQGQRGGLTFAQQDMHYAEFAEDEVFEISHDP